MYNVSQNYLAAIKQPNRTFKGSITIRDTAFSDSNIVSINIDENVNPSESFMLGSNCSAKLELTMINVPDSLMLENATVTGTTSLLVNGAYEDVPIGVYTVYEISKNKNLVSLTCYDNMIKAEKAYYSKLTYPTSINTVAQEICTTAGIELATALPDIQISKIPDGYTCREAIGFIASFLGSFARINKIGKLEIITYTDSGFAVTGHNCFKFTHQQNTFSIGKLSCSVGDQTLSVGLGTTEIQFENPVMTQDQLNSIYNTLKNLSYMPYEMEWQGNPALQAGDKISITDNDDTTIFNTLVMENKITYKGGFSATTTAVGKTETAQDFNTNGSTQNSIDRLVTDQANIKTLIAEKADITYLEANYAHITNGVLDNATIDVEKVNKLYANYAHITNGVLDNATIDVAKVNNLSANYVNVTQLEASNGRISTLESNSAKIIALLSDNAGIDTLSSNTALINYAALLHGTIGDAQIGSLSVGKVNAGDISTNKFRIVSDSGNMLISDNTMQIKDASRVRVQIGKDTNSDYNMYVWDAAGNLMFDALGLKASGIKDKIIRDDMVSDTANIDAKKINIDSLFSEINGSTNTIKSSQIYLDTQAETLNVAFTGLKTTVTDQGTALSNQGTSITTIQGQISSKIWNTDITTATNNIQIGIRNYVTNGNCENDYPQIKWKYPSHVDAALDNSKFYSGSKSLKLTVDTASGTIDRFYQLGNYGSLNGLIAGETYTFSAYVYVPSGQGINLQNICLKIFDYADGTYYSVNSNSPTAYDTWQQIIVTNTIRSTATTIFSRIGIWQDIQNVSAYFDNIMLTKGNKVPADYVQAPEDVAAYTDAAKAAAEGYTDNKITTVNTTISSQQSEIDQNKSDIALRVLTSDYTTDKTTINGQILSINTHLSTTDQSIITMQGLIDTKVTQTQVDSSINNLQIGCVNLLLKTATFDSSFWNSMSAVTINNGVAYAPNDTTKSHWTANTVGFDILPNQTYTISCKAKTDNANSMSKLFFNFDQADSWGALKTFPITNTDWALYSFTFTTKNVNTIKLSIGNLPSATDSYNLYWKECQLEIGSKVTGWRSAPEDTQSQIDSVTQRVATAETKITTDAIVNTVRSSTSYQSDLTGKVSVSDYQTYVSQTATEISNKVSSSDFNGNNIASLINQTATTIKIDAAKIDLSGYVTITNLGTAGGTTIDGGNIKADTITVDKLKSDIGGLLDLSDNTSAILSIGNYNSKNLYPDSSFELGKVGIGSHESTGYYAILTSASHTLGAKDGTHFLYLCISDALTATDYWAFLDQSIPVVAGKTYVISFWHNEWLQSGTFNSSSCMLQTTDGQDWVSIPVEFHADNAWHRTIFTWTCPTGVTWIKPRFGFKIDAGISARMTVDCVQIEEAPLSDWRNAPQEYNYGCLSLTDDYLRFSNGSGSYTEMRADDSGLLHHDAYGDNDYHYLMATDSGYLNSAGTVTVSLPAEFVGKKTKVSVSLKRTNTGGNILVKEIYLEPSDVNPATATFTVSGSVTYMSYNVNGGTIFTDGTASGGELTGGLDFTWIAIA